MAPMDALGRVGSILVLGGGSEIASEVVRRLLRDGGGRVLLAGRKPDGYEADFGPSVEVERLEFDAADVDGHAAFIEDAFARGGDVDLVLVAFGVLHDQRAAERDPRLAVEMANVNYTGVVSVSLEAADRLRRQGHGTIVLLSSVAAERPRRSNFLYGSAKAGADAFGRGLGEALRGSGVRVVVVRPGFVHTKMTEGMAPAPFSVGPESVAEAVAGALERGDDVVWVPPVLRWVMAALRHLPQAVFRRIDR